MTDDITEATNNQKVSTGQINKAVGEINEMASQIQKAAKQQLNGVHQLIDTTNDFTGLIVQNLASSKSITDATATLSSQADILLHSVDRFKLPVDINDLKKAMHV
jgi:methyl-accepting chemotaxis protein